MLTEIAAVNAPTRPHECIEACRVQAARDGHFEAREQALHKQRARWKAVRSNNRWYPSQVHGRLACSWQALDMHIDTDGHNDGPCPGHNMYDSSNIICHSAASTNSSAACSTTSTAASATSSRYGARHNYLVSVEFDTQYRRGNKCATM